MKVGLFFCHVIQFRCLVWVKTTCTQMFMCTHTYIEQMKYLIVVSAVLKELSINSALIAAFFFCPLHCAFKETERSLIFTMMKQM